MATSINPLWTAYNLVNNEGGEGYNPHQKTITTGRGEPLWSVLDDKKYRLENLLNATSDAEPRYEEIKAEIKVVAAALEIAKKAAL